MDCSIIPHDVFDGFYTLSTTDFFYPLVEDPFVQGKIACANVLSDMYSLGIDRCDNMLMLLGGCMKMSVDERKIVMREMIRGFNELARQAGTKVTGGQTVINEWPLIGGVAMTMAREEQFIRPEHAVPGDVIVLTKPLGTQVAVNLNVWLLANPQRWEQVSDLVTKEGALKAYDTAVQSMARLNKTGATLMQKYKAHAATDITGFGIVGHAANLARNQKEKVDFVIHTLPIIRHMATIDERVQIFKLMKGFSAETSGGLFIALPSHDAAVQFCEEIERLDGCAAWVVADVVAGEGRARIVDNPKIIDA